MYINRYIKYPKFSLLIVLIFLTYILFSWIDIHPLLQFFLSLGYFGPFLIGMFYSYGFTAPSTTGFLLLMGKSYNILAASIIAGLGSFLADYLIFRFIRHSFKDEVEKLGQEKIIKYIYSRIHWHIKKYIVPIIGCIVIASPLPDELGVALLAADKEISSTTFFLLSFFLNTAGIFILMLIGTHI